MLRIHLFFFLSSFSILFPRKLSAILARENENSLYTVEQCMFSATLSISKWLNACTFYRKSMQLNCKNLNQKEQWAKIKQREKSINQQKIMCGKSKKDHVFDILMVDVDVGGIKKHVAS